MTTLRSLLYLTLTALLIPYARSRNLLDEVSEGPRPLIEYSCDFQGPFPYMASLRDDNGGFRCGAVVIRSDAVLTAASCITPSLHQGVGISEVFLGGLDRDNPIERFPVEVAIPHDKFNGRVEDGYDIAVVKLDGHTCATPIPVLGRPATEGDTYLILGFGRTGPMEPLADELFGGNVTNFDFTTCNDDGVMPPLDENQLCTMSESCQCGSICEGDAGGPLLYLPTREEFKDTLMGIMSYATGSCGEVGTYGIHTDVQPQLAWLFTTLQSGKFLGW